MITKLSMEHYKLKFYLVYINDDPELTLTYLTTLSILGEIVFVHSRPRSQVSVYRTVGLLVCYYGSVLPFLQHECYDNSRCQVQLHWALSERAVTDFQISPLTH